MIGCLPESPTERVKQLKDEFLSLTPEMCCERAVIYTKVYQENESLPTVLKRAKALRKTLEEMSIFIQDGEVIVGHPASRPRSAEVFPEVNIEFMKEIDLFETREYNRLKVSPEVKATLLELEPYWQGKCPHDYLMQRRSEAIRQGFAMGLLSDPHEWSGFAHVAMDYRKLLTCGVEGMQAQIAAAKGSLKPEDPMYEDKLAFYQAEEEICQGMLAIARRYAALSREKALQERNPERRQELLTMAEVLDHVPAKPAATYQEALQTVWLMQVIPQIESNGFSITPGRFDQYCNSYLEKDLQAGTISLEYAQELTDLFFLKFCEILRVDSKGAAEVNAGYASGQNLVVGGVDADGNDATNLLSYICLMANRHIRLNQPNFTVRLHENTPEEFLAKVVESIGSGNGMPQVLNDNCIIPSLVEHGIPLREARDYIPVGCDEIRVHRHWARCNAGYINLAKLLEIAMNHGTDIKYGISLLELDKEQPATFEDFYQRYLHCLKVGEQLQIEESLLSDQIHREILPLPFVSLFLDDCVARGLDCTNGGAVYNTTGLVAVGTATVADSLYAIKRLVYDEKKMTLDSLTEILRSNFAGQEYLRQFIMNRFPKFGNDEDCVDRLAVGITDAFADELEKHRNGRGGAFWGALYSVSAQVGLGNVCSATPDGRLEGLPLSDGLTPMYGMDRSGPTAVLATLAKIHQKRFPNGIIVNQRMNGTLFKTPEGRRKMAQLLRAFVASGSFHWQFNIVDNRVLLAAQENPDEYRSLVVRVAGYSAIFVELSLKAQNSIIERYEADLA